MELDCCENIPCWSVRIRMGMGSVLWRKKGAKVSWVEFGVIPSVCDDSIRVLEKGYGMACEKHTL